MSMGYTPDLAISNTRKSPPSKGLKENPIWSGSDWCSSVAGRLEIECGSCECWGHATQCAGFATVLLLKPPKPPPPLHNYRYVWAATVCVSLLAGYLLISKH